MATYDDMTKILSEWAENVIIQIQDNLDSTNTTASGRTKESLRYEISDDEFSQTLRIYGRPYFQGVEEGRGAGKVPYKFTDILFQWATDKGIITQFGDTESKQRSVLYVVGQSIKHHGTQLYREGGRLDIYTNVINEELPKLEDDVSFFVKQSIAEIFNK